MKAKIYYLSKLLAAFAVLISLTTACGIYRARWPVDTRPDMKKVTADIQWDLKFNVEGVTEVSAVSVTNGYQTNSVDIRVKYASTDRAVLKQVANDIERRVATTLVSLRDDGDLTVAVKSDNYEAMPHDTFYPDHGTIVTWAELAKIYGLKRPNPWRR